MAKKLISTKNIEEYLCEGKFYVTKDMILSSSAKDYCKENNISVVYGEVEPQSQKPVETSKVEVKESLKEMVTRVLKNDFNIEDEKLVDIIVKKCEGVRS